MWAIWRLTLTAAVLAVLLVAQLGRHDDWFPLGMLGQYAVPRDPDGTVVNTYLEGIDRSGRTVPITLTASESGITRVELETHLPELADDPALLAGVVRAHQAAHPGTELTALQVKQRVHRFRDGAVAGPPTVRTVLTWRVP